MVEIRPVKDKKQLQQFVQFYYDLYRGSECAVPYLYSDEMATLRSDKNPSFECCESAYFLAFREEKSTTVPTNAGTAIRCVSGGSTSLTTSRFLQHY